MADFDSDFDQDRLGELYAQARAAEDRGDTAGAIAGFKKCLELDPDDHCGVVMRLAALGGATPQRAPPAYVATLFDQQAENFDEILVGLLGYDVPALARTMAGGLISRPVRILDLGCGTGLAGVAFADLSAHLTGVDLSEAILSFADDRGVYNDLYIADAIEFLESWDGEPFDLVIAADVLPYLGNLRPFAQAVRRALVESGTLIASTESRRERWGVTRTQRFNHNLTYLTHTFAAAEMMMVAHQAITVRREAGYPVPGDLVAMRRV